MDFKDVLQLSTLMDTARESTSSTTSAEGATAESSDAAFMSREHDVLHVECPCVRCGYNLQGLAASGVCPECGVGIALSLPSSLRNADHGYLDHLVRSLRIIRVSLLLKMAGGVGLLVWFSDASDSVPFALVLGGLLFGIGTLVGNVGAWQFARGHHPLGDSETNERVRWSVIAFGMMSVLLLATAMLDLGAVTAMVVILMWVSALGLGVTTNYHAAWLASRIPDDKFVAKARTLRYLIPFIAVVGSALGFLGPFAAWIVSYKFYGELRRKIQACRDGVLNVDAPT